SPADRDIHAPDAHAFVEEPADCKQEPLQDHEADEHAKRPSAGDWTAEHDRTDLVSERGKRMPRLNDRCFLFADFDFGWLRHDLLSGFSSVLSVVKLLRPLTTEGTESQSYGFFFNSGFGFLISAKYVVRGRVFKSSSKP